MAEQTGGGIVDGIDLYADVDNDFPAEDLAGNESGDLYDDVLTSSVGKEDDKKPPTPQDVSNHATAGPLASPPAGTGVNLYFKL